jgi:hypothetical protein
MYRSSIRSRSWGRALEIALVLGAAALVLANLLGSTSRSRRDRRLQGEALQTWEGEGGTIKGVDATGTVDSRAHTVDPPLHVQG